MSDIFERDLLGKVFFETSPNTGTATWTNHSSTLSNMSLSSGGSSAVEGVSDVDVGTAVIELVDNTATIEIGYWVRVRTLSGNVWAGFVRDTATRFEFINGVKYTIRSFYCADWVAYVGQFLYDRGDALEANGDQVTAMPYPASKRINYLNYSIDPTRNTLVVSRTGDSSNIISHSDTFGSLAQHLDLLANSVNGYWNSTTETPTNATTGRDNLINFSTGAVANSTVVFSDGSHTSGTPISYQGISVSQSSSSVSNTVVIKNSAQFVSDPAKITYNKDLIFQHEYQASNSSSVSSYGARQISLETNLDLPYSTVGFTSGAVPKNLCLNADFGNSIQHWRSSELKLSRVDLSKETVPWFANSVWSDFVLRGRTTAAIATATLEYSPTATDGVPVTGNTQYKFAGDFATDSTIANFRCQIRVDWLDEDQDFISTSNGTFELFGARYDWSTVRSLFTSPSTARYAKFRFSINRTSGANIPTKTRFHLCNINVFKTTNLLDSLQSYGQFEISDPFIYFPIGERNNSESVIVRNSLFYRAKDIADANSAPALAPENLTWNAQGDLTKAHLLKVNQYVSIWLDGTLTKQRIKGIRHQISRKKYIVELELSNKLITP
jgi:hypothetical protein